MPARPDCRPLKERPGRTPGWPGQLESRPKHGRGQIGSCRPPGGKEGSSKDRVMLSRGRSRYKLLQNGRIAGCGSRRSLVQVDDGRGSARNFDTKEPHDGLAAKTPAT